MRSIKETEEHSYVPEKKERKYVSLLGSVSHTYGNALAYMENYILGLFPDGLFQTIHVQSKIAHRQLKSTPQEYIKKTKPMIVFRPRIPSVDEDRFLKGTLLTERMTDLYSSQGLGNLMNFFHDPDHDLSIKYQLNRTVFFIDVILMFDTLIQQLDYWHYIQNAVRLNHPFILRTFFESFLPQEMLKIVSDQVGIPLYDSAGNTKEFLTYMNQHSGFPITYKLQGSTQTREFYRYYPASIETTISDLDRDEGEQVGSAMQHYRINFTVKMEFYSSGFYFIFGEKLFDLGLPKVDPRNTDLIPVFTDVLLREDLNLREGWQIYNEASCRLEVEEDSVNFNQMLNSSIRETLKYHFDNGLPIFDFIDVKVRRQGKMIHEGMDYSIKWDSLDIVFHQCDTFHTYHIIICINVEYINNLMKTIYHLE